MAQETKKDELNSIPGALREHIKTIIGCRRKLNGWTAEDDAVARRNPDLGKEAFQKRLEDSKKAIEEVVKALRTETIRIARKSVDDKDTHPVVFLDNAGNQILFASPSSIAQKEVFSAKKQDKTSGEDSSASSIESAEIGSVALLETDAVKEVNRLLAHTTQKRLVEEMDVATFHATAARNFRTISDEYKDLYGRIEKSISEVDDVLESQDLDASKNYCEVIMKKPELEEVQSRILEYSRYLELLEKYRNFLALSGWGVNAISKDFARESSIESYKDVTRPHAVRLERDGIFASIWPVLVGLATGAILLAILLFFASGNALVRDYSIPIAAIAALITYHLSVKFGITMRDGHLLRLREEILAFINEALRLPEEPPHPVSQELNSAGVDASTLQSANRKPAPPTSDQVDDDSTFRFPAISWSSLRMANAEKRELDLLEPIKKLAPRLASVEGEYGGYTQRMRFKNWALGAAVCALFLAVPYAMTWLHHRAAEASNRWVPVDKLAFISARGASREPCLLHTGATFLPTTSTYYVSTANPWNLAALPRSSVVAAVPAADVADKIASCIDALPSRPDQIGAAAKLVSASMEKLLPALKTNLPPELSGAVQSLATEVGANAAAVSSLTDRLNHLPGGGSIIVPDLAAYVKKLSDALETGSNRVAKAFSDAGSSATSIVPLIVQPPSNASGSSKPPVFITQFVSSDGTITTIGDRRTLVLPLFAAPVVAAPEEARYAPNGIDTEQEAYYFGLKQLDRLENGSMIGTVLTDIGEALNACAQQRKEAYMKADKKPVQLPVTVIGLANEKWQGSGNKDLLNRYLAEGRRQAILAKLEPSADVDFGKLYTGPAGEPSEIDLRLADAASHFGSFEQMRRDVAPFAPPGIDAIEALKKAAIILIDDPSFVRCGDIG